MKDFFDPSFYNASFYIAPMLESDLAAVVELEQVTRLNPWGYDGYRSELRHNPLAVMLVARGRAPFVTRPIYGFLAGRVQLSARHDGRELHIANVAVHPEVQRQGLGRRLLKEAFYTGRLYGATTAFLEVRQSNTGAKALYTSLGFTQIAHKRGFYANPTEDGLLMEAAL
ncbi:MAG: GNAT family N-acetyltransferase [Chloracidobacterium sp.]|uniref:GNAT family N-acetyltransferase n=1 Tax=Chloracidobacterium validum TaxID=2821543 RepID=A0ABX8B8G8_9BACT|nr:GNAT family N-acetyltransferase [Chloracidobacterium validum]QUW03232.1 GNAT family N-acetyltransferase [Chloracidobacterium validum]